MPANDTDPPLIRVLLERSASPIRLPQPGRAYRLRFEGRAAWLWGPVEVAVDAEGSSRWQLGAWGDPANVVAARERIREAFGSAAEVREEAIRDGLTRLTVGWAGGEPTDPKGALEALGFEGVRPIPTRGVVRISGANGAAVTSPGEIVMDPAGEWPVAVGSRRYRGRLVARAMGGEALVINELNLESYLRGVVPAEMGPSQFPELDALKAQTIAARTYAVAHLGDHADEGWDLCDTPTCQVYKGFDAEHSLSNRAIRDTAGLVAVYGGQPIDAMYTSTCGGHTEDVELLFRGRIKPYLRGVACAWERPIGLAGTSSDSSWRDRSAFSADVGRKILGLNPGADPLAVLERLQMRLGTPIEDPAALDVESFSSALLRSAGLDPPPGIAPASNSLDRLLFLSDLYQMPLDPPSAGLTGDWAAAAALAVLVLRGDVVSDRGETVPRADGAGIFPRRARHSELLPSPLPLWERWEGSYRPVREIEILPGTVLERIRTGDRVEALVVRQSEGGGEADRRSAWREWVRDKSWTEMERLLGVDSLERLTVTRRSPSGRVVGLAAVSKNGATREWTGFDIRQALELPETLFAMHLRSDPAGNRRVHFLGRGWGHGVGLCQNGAYGLARVGMDYERILKHYYSGIEIVMWPGPVRAR
jgi:stage II sporulation protein D